MNKKRLLTKSDFDGLVCSALLKKSGMIDDICFVHGFDIESGEIEIFPDDIMCNLPYSEKSKINFSYGSEQKYDNQISTKEAKSCSRIIYNYLSETKYENPELVKKLIDSVDKTQSADFTIEEVLKPEAWNMLSFITDSRTGLGRIRAFRISNYALMMSLVDLLLVKKPEEILQMPDVEERVDYYKESESAYKEMLLRLMRKDEEILILDLRDELYPSPANRFVKYAMFPETKFSIQVAWGLKQKNTVLALGKSIFSKPNDFNLSEIISEMGGIAHRNSGSIQVENALADEILEKLIKHIKAGMKGA